MKKCISAALALAWVLGLAACGSAPPTGSAAPAVRSAISTETAADSGIEPVAPSDYDRLVEKGTMVIGYTACEPMNYTDENGSFVGFDTELATAVCEILGLQPEFNEIDWSTRLIELESGRIDAVWSGMTLTDEIQANQACSRPYAENAQVIVMKAGNSYAGTASLADASIAVELGSAGEDIVDGDADLSQAKKVTESVQTKCLAEVADGTVDAAVLDRTVARAMTGEGAAYADLAIVDELNTEEYGVAFRKGSDVAERVNGALDELLANGRMQELSRRYGVPLAG